MLPDKIEIGDFELSYKTACMSRAPPLLLSPAAQIICSKKLDNALA